jgi:hypothetical protein
MDRDQFFQNLFDDNSREAGANREQRQLSYENRIVRRVITECGVPRVSWGWLVNNCKAATGGHELSFEWFNYTFREFPARLLGKRIGYCARRTAPDGSSSPLSLYQLQFAELFKPRHNLVLRTIARALQAAEHNASDPFVFVFPIVRRMFCAHNLEIPTSAALDAPRIQWIMQTSPTGSKMIIESTASLFAAIGSEWFQMPD